MKQLLAIAVAFCGVQIGLTAGDIAITDLPGNGKVSKLDVNSKERSAGGTFVIVSIPEYLKGQQMVSVPRGGPGAAGAAFALTIDKPALVYMLVHDRGKAEIPEGWTKLAEKVRWKLGGSNFSDSIYSKKFDAGKIEVPAHTGKDGGSFGIPNAVVITEYDGSLEFITPGKGKISKLAVNSKDRTANGAFVISAVPDALKDLPMVSVGRGAGGKAGEAFTVTVGKPVTAYLLVHDRGKATVPEGWTKLEEKVRWKVGNTTYADSIYEQKFDAGKIDIPAHDGKDGSSFGIPNAIVLKAE